MHLQRLEGNNSQLSLLQRLFLLAAWHSLQAASALAPQRRFTIHNSGLKVKKLMANGQWLMANR